MPAVPGSTRRYSAGSTPRPSRGERPAEHDQHDRAATRTACRRRRSPLAEDYATIVAIVSGTIRRSSRRARRARCSVRRAIERGRAAAPWRRSWGLLRTSGMSLREHCPPDRVSSLRPPVTQATLARSRRFPPALRRGRTIRIGWSAARLGLRRRQCGRRAVEAGRGCPALCAAGRAAAPRAPCAPPAAGTRPCDTAARRPPPDRAAWPAASRRTRRAWSRAGTAPGRDRGRPRLLGQRDDPLHLPRPVVDARHQRRDQDPGGDADPVELRHRLQPRAGMRRVRLGRPPRLLVQRRHRQARADARPLLDLQQQILVASTSGDFVRIEHGFAKFPHRLPDPAHQLVTTLDPLVRGQSTSPARLLALARRRRASRPAGASGAFDLDHHLLVEITASV